MVSTTARWYRKGGLRIAMAGHFKATNHYGVKSLSKFVVVACILTTWGMQPARANESKQADDSTNSQSSVSSVADAADASATNQKSKPDADQGNAASRLFWKWFRMGKRIEAEQPNWLSPLATTSGRLKQEFRYDVWQQPTPGGSQYNFGGTKGLEFIVAPRVQLLIGPPPYISHTGTATRDGFGDVPLMMKFQLAAAPPREGDYLLTVILAATVPGGSNSMRDAVLSPAIAFGKGWRAFDMQTTFGENLPTGDTTALGRQLVSNTAFQYRVFSKFWPEFEVNSTFFVTGKDSGATQVFLTPGLGFGRVHLWRTLRFSAAAGMQIAATQFHTYNHRAMFSVRYSF